MLGSDGDGGAACAKFCAARLPKMAAHSFSERVRATPLSALADDSGAAVADEAEAAALVWADALTAGFGMCDQAALNEAQGACGAMLCVVARSGVYVASVGLGRAVIGTEEPGGQGAFVDEASAPHRRDGEEEADAPCRSLSLYKLVRSARLDCGLVRTAHCVCVLL